MLTDEQIILGYCYKNSYCRVQQNSFIDSVDMFVSLKESIIQFSKLWPDKAFIVSS